MPFRAECMFCHHGVRVPDHALGASVQCPKCGSYFTLVPAAEQAEPARQSVATPTVSPPRPAPPIVAEEPAEPHDAPIAPAEAVAEMPGPADESDAPPTRRSLDPFGVTALLLAGVALVCASVYALGVLVLPLSGIGLLVGLAGVGLTLATDQPRPLVPGIGSSAGGLVLFVALLFPGLLGPTYYASRTAVVEDPVTIRAVPLPGQPVADLGSVDWVDASRAALQQNKLRVQVTGATIGKVEVQTTPKRKLSKEDYLTLRVRAQHTSGMREFTAEPGGPRARPHERLSPTLTDNLGKTYPPRNPAAAEGGGQQVSAVFPVEVADDVWIFDAPAPGVEFFKLEIPAATWGGTGAFRFTIPKTMLRPDVPLSRPASRTKT